MSLPVPPPKRRLSGPLRRGETPLGGSYFSVNNGFSFFRKKLRK
ncbi:hypothetical protein ACUXAI_003609 [Sphingomonas sanguinis]